MGYHLPAPIQIREILEGILGKEVTVDTGTPVIAGGAEPVTVGIFVDDALNVAAVAICDVPFSANTGAAIGLAPPAQAEAAIATNSLDETLRENVYEVLNITAATFNQPGAHHVKLYRVNYAGDTIPPDVLVKALTLGRRLDLNLSIAGYGNGRLSIVLMPDPA